MLGISFNVLWPSWARGTKFHGTADSRRTKLPVSRTFFPDRSLSPKKYSHSWVACQIRSLAIYRPISFIGCHLKCSFSLLHEPTLEYQKKITCSSLPHQELVSKSSFRSLHNYTNLCFRGFNWVTGKLPFTSMLISNTDPLEHLQWFFSVLSFPTASSH